MKNNINNDYCIAYNNIYIIIHHSITFEYNFCHHSITFEYNFCIIMRNKNRVIIE